MFILILVRYNENCLEGKPFFVMDTDYVQLTHLNSGFVSRSDLFKIHQNLLSEGRSNELNTDQLVLALGGIDKILSKYLSIENNIDLSQKELNKIESIITNESTVSKDDNNNAILIFDSGNTFIRYLFPSAIANKITKFVYHKITLYLLIIISLFLSICSLFVYNSHSKLMKPTWLVIGTIYSSFMSIYLILLISTMNAKAFKLSCKKFIFWFKIVAAVKWTICYPILMYHYEIWF